MPVLSFKEGIRQMALVLINDSIKELDLQGHVASGRGIASFEEKTFGFDPVIAQVWAAGYLLMLDEQQQPKRVPLADLIKWAADVRGGSPNVQEQFTFAKRVQRSISIEGVPTRGSYNFSRNGRRTEWTKYAILAAAKDVDIIAGRIDEPLEILFNVT